MSKKIDFKVLILTLIVCLIPILIGIYYYNSLPDMVAIHFDIKNEPNGYFSKNGFVFGMPLIMFALQSFMCIINDLSDKNKEANKKAIAVYKWIIPILGLVLYIVTVMFALGIELDIRKIVMPILGIIFVIMGNYLPKIKNNSTMGLKNMNFASKSLENKYQRIVAYGLIFDGILAIISILFSEIVSVSLIGLIIIQNIIIYIFIIIENSKVKKDNK